jgi:hypothetical protein
MTEKKIKLKYSNYMKAFLKKLFKLFSISKQSDLKTLSRQSENMILRIQKKSDIKRWRKNEELFQDWDERTMILGSFIISNANIIEFGAGNMALKSFLNNYKSYTASDILCRFEETIVCDLNQTIPFDLLHYDTAVFSGVLEYVYDIETVFTQMSSSIKQIVLSYCCVDIVKLSRDKNGWLSDYKKNELEAIFKKYNYRIENYQEWRNQSLYNLMKE